jgi:hypothetical protein
MTDSLFWYGVASGVMAGVAALMLAALVSRLFREPATHRAGIDEDEDDPEETGDVIRLPCPTCSGPVRETVGMVCQTCGTDYSTSPPLRIDPSLYRYPPPDVGFGDGTPSAEYEPPPMSLGPPPTYPETPEEHTP